MQGPRSPEFERIIRNSVAKNMAGGIFGIIMLAALAIFFLGFGFAMLFVPIIILGLIPLGGIFLVISRGRGEFKGGEYWINQMLTDPRKIIWIKPIRMRHTAAYVLTLYTEMHFQIINVDGLSIDIRCKDMEMQRWLLYGLKSYAPYAHIGYSDMVAFYYRSNRNTFLQELKENRLYVPMEYAQID